MGQTGALDFLLASGQTLAGVVAVVCVLLLVLNVLLLVKNNSLQTRPLWLSARLKEYGLSSSVTDSDAMYFVELGLSVLGGLCAWDYVNRP